MLTAALRSGAAGRRAVFEVFARALPHGRRYGVVAGTGRLLEALQQFRFGPDELAFLRDNHMVDEGALRYLESYRFRGDIWGYGEGDCYFPGSPILVVEAPFAEAVVLETLVLAILNHDSAIASAASRMVNAADGRPIIEMGSRRTHEMAAVASARAAYTAGFSSTSNLEAGRDYGIPTSGTSAHAFSLVHDSERDAFAAQLAALGQGHHLAGGHVRRGPRGAHRGGAGRARPGRGPHRQRRPPDGGPAGPRPAGRAGRAGHQDRAQRRPERILDRGAGRRPGRRVRGRDLPGHRVRGAHRGAGLQARGPGQGRRRRGGAGARGQAVGRQAGPGWPQVGVPAVRRERRGVGRADHQGRPGAHPGRWVLPAPARSGSGRCCARWSGAARSSARSH